MSVMFTFSLALVTMYVTCVRLLRYRRLRAIEKKYSSIWRCGNLTPNQAQEIVHSSVFFESPFMMRIGVQLALFRVYGIPSVSALLLSTGQLTSPELISKRIADTGTLIATWLTCPLGLGGGSGVSSGTVDPRGAIAVARVNFLHNKYKIANDDFLYNLALFIREPIEWTARYDWRAPTDLECTAMFVFWKEIGRRMDIRNLWDTYDDMLRWAVDYETTYMVPSSSSHTVAETTINYYLKRLPNALGIRATIKQVAICLLDQRLREAMGFPAPPNALHACVHGLLRLRGIFVRYLCIPRRTPFRFVLLDSPAPRSAGSLPRMHAAYRRPIPWYWPESTGIRKKLESFQVKVGLRSVDSLPGPKWKSEGYRLEELGPTRFEHDGKDQVMESAAAMLGQPVIGPWSLSGGKSEKTD